MGAEIHKATEPCEAFERLGHFTCSLIDFIRLASIVYTGRRQGITTCRLFAIIAIRATCGGLTHDEKLQWLTMASR